MEVLDMLNELANAGYSVQLSTNRDTAVAYKGGGHHCWTCSIKSVRSRAHKSLKPGIRIRKVASTMGIAVSMAYKEAEREGALNDG